MYIIISSNSLVSILRILHIYKLPCGSAGRESICNAGNLGSIPGLGRSPGEGKGYPLQYSGLENSMDSIVHGVAKSRTWLSNFHFQVSSLPLSLSLLLNSYNVNSSLLDVVQKVSNYSFKNYFFSVQFEWFPILCFQFADPLLCII